MRWPGSPTQPGGRWAQGSPSPIMKGCGSTSCQTLSWFAETQRNSPLLLDFGESGVSQVLVTRVTCRHDLVSVGLGQVTSQCKQPPNPCGFASKSLSLGRACAAWVTQELCLPNPGTEAPSLLTLLGPR